VKESRDSRTIFRFIGFALILFNLLPIFDIIFTVNRTANQRFRNHCSVIAATVLMLLLPPLQLLQLMMMISIKRSLAASV